MSSVGKGFEKMGARVQVSEAPGATLSLDIRRDHSGEYFLLTKSPETHPQVLDVRPKDRHLLLAVRGSKFLCGHDERHWFVAAIPQRQPINSVPAAMDALKPAAVWQEMARAGVKPGQRNRRKTNAFVRQGEWFFIPRPRLVVDQLWVMRDEPIRRGRGKPHICQYLVREGGQVVMVHDRYPNGLTPAQFRNLPEHTRGLPGWRQMMREATVYVRGAVRHADHKTIHLPCWHQVVLNTETQSASMRHVAFLD